MHPPHAHSVQIAENVSEYASPLQLQHHQFAPLHPQHEPASESTLPIVPNLGFILPATQGMALPAPPHHHQTMMMAVNPMGSAAALTLPQQPLMLTGAGEMEGERHFFPPVSSSHYGGGQCQPMGHYREGEEEYQASTSLPSMRAHSVQQQHSFSNEFDRAYPGYPQPSHSSMSNYPELRRHGGMEGNVEGEEESERHAYSRRRLASYPMHESAAQYHQQQQQSHLSRRPMAVYHRRDYAYHPTQAHYQQQQAPNDEQQEEGMQHYSAYRNEVVHQLEEHLQDDADMDDEVDVDVDVDMEVEGLLAAQHYKARHGSHPNCTSTSRQQHLEKGHAQHPNRHLAYPDSSSSYLNDTAPQQQPMPLYPSHSSTFPSNGGKRQFGGLGHSPAGALGGGRSSSITGQRPRVMTAPMNANNVYLFEEEGGGMHHQQQHHRHHPQPHQPHHSSTSGVRIHGRAGHGSRTLSQSEPPPATHLEHRLSSAHAYGQAQMPAAFEMTGVVEEPVLSAGAVVPMQATAETCAPYSQQVRISYEAKKLL